MIIPGAWRKREVDSRSGSPGITRDWSGSFSCMRFGFGACTLGSVDASTLAWLSASICPCVFMFEGSAEPPAAAATTRNSLSFRRPTPSRRRRGGRGGIPPTVKGEAIVNPPTFPTCWVVEQAAFLFAVRAEERDVAKQLQFFSWIKTQHGGHRGVCVANADAKPDSAHSFGRLTPLDYSICVLVWLWWLVDWPEGETTTGVQGGANTGNSGLSFLFWSPHFALRRRRSWIRTLCSCLARTLLRNRSRPNKSAMSSAGSPAAHWSLTPKWSRSPRVDKVHFFLTVVVSFYAFSRLHVYIRGHCNGL